MPVSALTVHPEAWFTPFNATSKVPATGFVIVRVQVCAPEVYRFTN